MNLIIHTYTTLTGRPTAGPTSSLSGRAPPCPMEDSYLNVIKSVAMAFGYAPEDIDQLCALGFTPEEIEEYLYGRDLWEEL